MEYKDTADQLLGICDDWNANDIEEHLLWLIDNPEEIADGYDKSIFKMSNVDEIMFWVKLLKK
jgi:hypothetical protein